MRNKHDFWFIIIHFSTFWMEEAVSLGYLVCADEYQCTFDVIQNCDVMIYTYMVKRMVTFDDRYICIW